MLCKRVLLKGVAHLEMAYLWHSFPVHLKIDRIPCGRWTCLLIFARFEEKKSLLHFQGGEVLFNICKGSVWGLANLNPDQWLLGNIALQAITRVATGSEPWTSATSTKYKKIAFEGTQVDQVVWHLNNQTFHNQPPNGFTPPIQP